MSDGEMLTIFGFAASALITAGAALARLSSQGTRLSTLERRTDDGFRDQGQRIGKLETAAAIADRELSRPYHVREPGAPVKGGG